MNNYLYWHIMLFQDLGTLLFKPLAALGGLKNKLPQVLKQHNVPIEVIIHTLIIPNHFRFYCCNLMNNNLYCHIMLFQDYGILLFKPLAALGGLKNKLPQVLKQHNVPIEAIIHTLVTFGCSCIIISPVYEIVEP